MAHTDATVLYTLELNGDELRLVLMGLAGILYENSDVQSAAELNVKLLRQRTAILKQALSVAEGALGKAQQAIAEQANPEEPETPNNPKI